MIDQAVLARCNLFGVFRNMEYLVENDKECAQLVKEKNIAIQFNVKNGPKGNLSFKNGKAEMKAGKHKCNIKLGFTSPEHFNKMVNGKANPIPLKGITKIGFLTGPFTKLGEILEGYLRADEKKLKDKLVYKINTEMTTYAAIFALVEIANYDDLGMANAQHIPDGIIQISIKDSVGIELTAKDGILTGKKGYADDPRAILSFSSLDAAYQILNGKLDTFTAIAGGDMEMKGFIPMIEHMSPILDLVGKYLA